MLFLWDCRNRNLVLELVATKYSSYQEASNIAQNTVETAQCYSYGFVETEIQHRNIVQNIEHIRKQVILLKTLSKQLNAIPMGLSKQKSSIEI